MFIERNIMILTYVISARKSMFPLKIVCIRLMVRIQRRKIFFVNPSGLSVRAHSNSRKHSSNAFKLACGIHIYHCIFRIENGVHKIDGSFTESYKRITRHNSQWVKTLKRAFYHVYTTLNITKPIWVHEQVKKRNKYMYIYFCIHVIQMIQMPH